MIAALLDVYETVLMRIFLWSGGKLWPTVDIYAPGRDGDPDDERAVKAVIFADSPETLNAILRGWTNPDAAPDPRA